MISNRFSLKPPWKSSNVLKEHKRIPETELLLDFRDFLCCILLFPLYRQTWFSHAKPRFSIVFHSDYPLISAIPQRPRLFCSQFVAMSDSPQNHMTQLQMNDSKEIAKWKNWYTILPMVSGMSYREITTFRVCPFQKQSQSAGEEESICDTFRSIAVYCTRHFFSAENWITICWILTVKHRNYSIDSWPSLLRKKRLRSSLRNMIKWHGSEWWTQSAISLKKSSMMR